MLKFRLRRISVVALIFAAFSYLIFSNLSYVPKSSSDTYETQIVSDQSQLASNILEKLVIADKYDQVKYNRTEFGDSWATYSGCDTRNIILNRDLKNVAVNSNCEVISGELNDPYTGKLIYFTRGSDTSSVVQIDHVVALSDAWKSGAYAFDDNKRLEFANDPLELLAVDGKANQQKSDGDASKWLPSNKPFRCQYVARQIAVKFKYSLKISQSEYQTIKLVLSNCANQLLPKP